MTWTIPHGNSMQTFIQVMVFLENFNLVVRWFTLSVTLFKSNYKGQSNENRTPAIKHIPPKIWQHCCYVLILSSVGQETYVVKTHRATQLFLYCSRREHSVKCVRPALEIMASKEEQRGVVSFLMAQSAVTRHKIITPWTESIFCMVTPVPILPIW